MAIKPILTGLLWILSGGGLLLVHVRASLQRGRTAIPLLLVLDLLAAVFWLVAVRYPELHALWMQEDGWVEWGTFFAFSLAASANAVLFWKLLRARERGLRTLSFWVPVVVSLGVALFCLFSAGEEISWGQRLFGFQPPEILLENNFQQEANLHNILKGRAIGGFELESKNLLALVAAVFGILFPIAAHALARHAEKLGKRSALTSISPPLFLVPWFAAIALAELTYPVPFTGEICEFMLGLLFLSTAALQVPLTAKFNPSWKTVWRTVSLIGISSLLGIAAPPVTQRIFFGTDEQLAAQVRVEMAALRRDLETPGVAQPRLFRKRYLHTRLFTAVREGYLDFGNGSLFLGRQSSPGNATAIHPRRDRLGYFLDPWNNPYWLVFERSGRTVIYSFGPNRRRDTDVTRVQSDASLAEVLGGDDIGIDVGAITSP